MNTAQLRDWFENSVRMADGRPYLLDNEQALAVVDSHKNALVTARAGSGKTHTLVAKIIYLIAIDRLKPNEIMAFVFNKDAATEINERLRGILVNGNNIVDENVRIAHTFHSFAHSIVSNVNGRGSFGNILMDGEIGADTSDSRSLYIQDILSRIVDSDSRIHDWIYTYFRDKYFKVDKLSFKSPEEYYTFIRNHESRTLDGKSVKSFSEKVIADFFFEHGVRYTYEPEYYPSNFVKREYSKPEYAESLKQKQSIKGDFYLADYKIVWEHWAISGNETAEQKLSFNESHMIGDYKEYVKNMSFKKFFYHKNWLIDKPIISDIWYNKEFDRLIESTRANYVSREEFEDYLHDLCSQNGIKLNENNHDDLVRKAWKKQVKNFTETIVQFIDRTQQMYFDSIDELENRISSEPEVSLESIKRKKFYQIGIMIYKEYIRRLSLRDNNGLIYVNRENETKLFSDYGTDFSMLLQSALKLLLSGQAVDYLNRQGDIKIMLIDEFQDFSRLFYENLTALRAIFPDSKLFCVGDNWQAINRFAGSEDRYYDNFSEYFEEDNIKLMLPTNYRSSASIVNIGNKVMKDLLNVDESSFAKSHDSAAGNSKITTIDLYKYQVMPPKSDFRFDANLQKYIEVISKLIVEHKNDERIIILCRRNKMLINYNFWGIVRYRVRDYVTNSLNSMTKKQFDSVVRTYNDTTDVMTVHKSKGLEAETVILVEVDPKSFPSINNNAHLFKIFGDSEDQTLKDETRLLYVALTRAKKNLYVLWGTYEHAEGQSSDFVKILNNNGAVIRDVTKSSYPEGNQLRYHEDRIFQLVTA